MARIAKETQVFTVRLADGSRVGSFSAYTDKQAIDAAVRELSVQSATFRRSVKMVATVGMTAKVESFVWKTPDRWN